MAYKILYVGQKKEFDSQFISEQLSLMNNFEIKIVKVPTAQESLEHFFDNEPILLMLIEDSFEGMAEFVETLRFDEVYTYLPILLVVEKNDPDTRKVYYNLGIDNFIEFGSDQDELTMSAHVAIRYKVRIDAVMERLRRVSEENITRSIQLDILRRYLPRTVWNQTESMAGRQAFAIPEQEQELAIFFADLQSFTTLSEGLTPSKVVEILNEIFAISTEVIYENDGDIDKFIGDAILAVFPKASRAMTAAVEIQMKMAALNEKRKFHGETPLQFRIGVHYGRIVRGSVGGVLRSDHTLIGDAVNTAQRLESMSPAGDLVASQALIDQIKKAPEWIKSYQCFELKGKQEPVCACTIGDALKASGKTFQDLLKKIGKK